MVMARKDKISMLSHMPPHHVELNKLPTATLMKLCVVFGADGTKATSSKEELVEIVRRCFIQWKLDEFGALEVFADRLKVSRNKRLALLKAPPQPSISKRSRREQHNRPTPVECSNNSGDDMPVSDINNDDNHVLVAAKVKNRWILARLDPEEEIALSKKLEHRLVSEEEITPSKTLALRDEDDPNVVFYSPSYDVIPLYGEYDPNISRGSRVLAVFPDTTAFYPATVIFLGRESVICFDEDDEQTRHVPRKYVIPMDDGLEISKPPRRATESKNINTTPSKRQRRKTTIGTTDIEMSNGGSLVNAPHSSVNGPQKIFLGGTGGQRSRGGSTIGGETYANMISKSLHNLPDHQGSFKDICKGIEQFYSSQLNWRLESDTRHTPVWQSSVRKILSSSKRFTHDKDRTCFSFAPGYRP